MLRRVLAVFDRFAAARLDAARPGPPLRDGAGRELGHVALVRLRGRRLVVAGAARGEAVTLRRGPDVVAARLDPARENPFELSIPLSGEGGLQLLLAAPAGGEVALPLRAPSLPLARAWLWPPFALRLLRAAPDVWRWQRTRDPALLARIRGVLALDIGPEASPVDPEALRAPEAPLPRPDRPVTLILPVFDAFDDLRDCLARVEAHTDLPWRLLLVEDASRDPRVRPWLRDWADGRGPLVELLENEANLGFVGSVNRGLARAREIDPDAPVVLLNSDAMLPAAWASRLLAPLVADPSVASVTPMSNDSEVTSVPALGRRSPLAPGQGDAIDGEARRLDPVAASAPMPTGVGFCMAVSPRALAEVGHLDPAFGRGYGEEVDWCQRARSAGGRHLGTGALFVEHRGGGSFGEAKAELIARHGRIISARYPRFDREVQEFIDGDPLATPRLALALAWAAARGAALEGAEAQVPVILAHSIGGGAEMALRRRIRREFERLGRPSVVLRVGGLARWRIEVHGEDGALVAAQTSHEPLLRRLLEPLRHRRVVYACGVSDPDPVTIPSFLLRLAEEAEAATLEVELHDYFPVSPSYTLLDSRGRFVGPVVAGGEARDPAHRTRRPDGTRVDLEAWRAAWAPLLARAEVTAFSRASLDLLLAAYPEAAARARIAPHPPLAEVAPVPRPAGPRVLGVLGNIAAHKGAALVQGIARLLPSRGGGIARLALLGDIAPGFPLPRSVRVHGAYEPGDIAGLARRHGVTDWLIPSVWPETFSFTTREALATGLPVFAFALGAQGEAVAAAPNGRPLPFRSPPDPAETLAAIEAA
jgi:GT2 family glycosyltransferase